jgi:hypothetical protein
MSPPVYLDYNATGSWRRWSRIPYYRHSTSTSPTRSPAVLMAGRQKRRAPAPAAAHSRRRDGFVLVVMNRDSRRGHRRRIPAFARTQRRARAHILYRRRIPEHIGHSHHWRGREGGVEDPPRPSTCGAIP